MKSRILAKTVAVGVFCFCLAVVMPARAELLYATNGSLIASFDSATPGTVTSVTVSGLQPSETLVGIDLRPLNALLYGVGSTSLLYSIDPLTGAATQVGTAGAFTLIGTAFGTDFNPVPDRLRQVSNTEQNLRLNPADGTALTDGALNPAGNVVAVAYSNNDTNPGTGTTLYAIDSASGNLGIITVPNDGGPINTVGSLGLGTSLNENIGFDISGLGGVAFASITTGAAAPVSQLYTIDLTSGTATLVGQIGDGTVSYLGLTAAAAPIPEPSTYALLGAGALLLVLRRFRRRTA